MSIRYKLKSDWQTARPRITKSMSDAGIRIFQSFGLKFSEYEFDHKCSRLSPEEYDCEIIVLLLYTNDHPIVSILGHCANGIVEFGLGDCPNPLALSEEITRAFLKAQKMLDSEFA